MPDDVERPKPIHPPAPGPQMDSFVGHEQSHWHRSTEPRSKSVPKHRPHRWQIPRYRPESSRRTDVDWPDSRWQTRDQHARLRSACVSSNLRVVDRPNVVRKVVPPNWSDRQHQRYCPFVPPCRKKNSDNRLSRGQSVAPSRLQKMWCMASVADLRECIQLAVRPSSETFLTA